MASLFGQYFRRMLLTFRGICTPHLSHISQKRKISSFQIQNEEFCYEISSTFLFPRRFSYSAVSQALKCVLVISINSLNVSKLILMATWFSGLFPNRGTIRPLAFVSPGPLSATSRKSALEPGRSCAVLDKLFPSSRMRPYSCSFSAEVPPIH